MNYGVGLALGFILFMAVLLAAFVGLIIYMDAGRPTRAATTPSVETPATATTTSLSTSTTLQQEHPETSPSTSMAASTTTITSTSTTTTLLLKTLNVTYSPKKLYKNDDAVLDVKSGGVFVGAATIYLDGLNVYQTEPDAYRLISLSGGEHRVVVQKEGYYNATLPVGVDNKTYATSIDVHRELTPQERQDAFNKGKADVRFYYTYGCPNCNAVLPRLNKVVDDNRNCVVYEKLNVYKLYGDELGLTGVIEFPVIVVEGRYGRFVTEGIVSMTKIQDLISEASGCDVS